MMGASFGSSTGAWWMKLTPTGVGYFREVEAVADERGTRIKISRAGFAPRRYATNDDGGRDQSGKEKSQKKTCDGAALH